MKASNLATKVQHEIEIRRQLRALVGQEVTVENDAHIQMENGKLQICLNGTLDAPADDGEGDPNFLLRVKECYNGTSCLSFCEAHVLEIFTQPSRRVCITIK